MIDPYDPTEEFSTDGGEPRITEVTIDVDDVIQTNMRFFKDDAYEYEDAHAFTHLETRRSIKLDESKRHDLERIIENFPADEPLVSQSALWMHAIVGVHFFPDANHRTAMATIRKMMEDNDIGMPGEGLLTDLNERTEAARNASKEERRKLDIDMGNYYEKDSLYKVWMWYFEDVLDQ